MSNDREGNVFERLFRLWAAICKMIVDGVRDPQMVADALQRIVSMNVYLRRLFSDIVIGATDGTETLKGSGVFWGGVYGLELPAGKPAPVTKATVHEMVLDGTFRDIFGNLGEGRPKWRNTEQVAKFCDLHRDKLRKDGYGTFFELKGGFVVYVLFDANGRLKARVHPLGYDNVWRAEHRQRFVFPQQ